LSVAAIVASSRLIEMGGLERQIEGLRAEAYAVLGSIPEYRALKAQDQKAVRDLMNKELERFKATASSVSRGRFRR
jgi:hypothetical protein